MAPSHLFRVGTGIVLSILSNSAVSEHLIEGIKAYQEKQYEQAYAIFTSHADITNPMAMYYLSALYLAGKGVEENEEEAFKYCKRAAEEGVVEAQFQLGMMYLTAVGIPQEDEDRALEWLWRAADNGNKEASQMFDFVINNDFTFGC